MEATTHPSLASRPRRRIWRFVLLALAAIVALLSTVAADGCSERIAYAIVTAPNHGRAVIADPPARELERHDVDRQLRINVGPPGASLSVWVIEPDLATPPTGTVFVLHGIQDRKTSQVGVGQQLSLAGYRAVLVDLRGHGASTGDWMTYGVRESSDMKQTLDALSAQGLVSGNVGVVGFSYGGATAIQWAAIDPRVRAVVAVAPFRSLQDIAPIYLEKFAVGWFMSDQTERDALERAGQLADFDPGQASPVQAVAATDAAVLLVHSKRDERVPHFHSMDIHDAAGGPVELLLINEGSHQSTTDGSDMVAGRRILDWLDRWLGTEGAP